MRASSVLCICCIDKTNLVTQLVKIYRIGEFRALTTGTQVMEGTIVVYIVDKMIPKINF